MLTLKALNKLVMNRIKPETTFCQVPFVDDIKSIEADIAIIGAPHGTPYKPGVASHAAEGADAVRKSLSWYSTGKEQMDFDSELPVFAGAEVVDVGNVSHDLQDGAQNRETIAEVTKQILGTGIAPILLGGDDSVPIPLIDALGDKYQELVVVQVDAHIDWRQEVDGVTHGFSSTMRRASEMLHVKHIIQIGARGPGSARQQDYLDAKDWGVQFFSARQIHQNGLTQAIQAIPENSDVILSIDVDGIDPSVVPGVILPAFGGLNYQQMLDVIQGTAKRANIIAATFVEFVPQKDINVQGAQAIARLVCNVINMMAR